MCSRPPWVDAAAPARLNVWLVPPWSAVAEVTTILLPASTVGAVFAVNRNTSSVIGRSGVNATCSVPCTVLRSVLTTKFSRTTGRCGSGSAYDAGQSAGAADPLGEPGAVLGALLCGGACVEAAAGSVPWPDETEVHALSANRPAATA